ncbi:MAG: deoxyribonuclease V [Dehalococcoidia bacterium]
MKARQLHGWDLNVREAMELQRHLAAQVSTANEIKEPRFIAGVDISAPDRTGVAKGAAVVVTYPGLELEDCSVVEAVVEFPYIPGLLSFRESPLVISALEGLSVDPDLVMVDGQGLAHPRRFGIACHLGLFFEVPTIGCAKSRLCGSHAAPENRRGAYAELTDGPEVIGAALRTKVDTNPIYVSIGHMIDLDAAVRWTLECCRGYRVPEPTRYAHLAAGGQLKTRPRPGERGRQLSLLDPPS